MLVPLWVPMKVPMRGFPIKNTVSAWILNETRVKFCVIEFSITSPCFIKFSTAGNSVIFSVTDRNNVHKAWRSNIETNGVKRTCVMLWWVERGERNREAASELVIMLIRMICGSPQNRERSLQRCSPAATCWSRTSWMLDALRSYPRLQSTWLGPNPQFDSTRLGCALGPWRNQFKWLSVYVIDFHFTRLSRKMHYHPAPVYIRSSFTRFLHASHTSH